MKNIDRMTDQEVDVFLLDPRHNNVLLGYIPHNENLYFQKVRSMQILTVAGVIDKMTVKEQQIFSGGFYENSGIFWRRTDWHHGFPTHRDRVQSSMFCG